MAHSAADDAEETLGPIDLDRLAVDADYRRALMLRLRSEAKVERAAESDPPAGSAPKPARD
jgi:hypothetical protein